MTSAFASVLSPPKEWRFSQCFGEMTPATEQNDCDILSAVEFDQTGKYLATGDRGGRVVVFETDLNKPPPKSSKSKRAPSASSTAAADYKFYCEFQSHDQEFDYLKSLEIEEKINQIKWCSPNAGNRFLLSSNDKTIKLWKISDKVMKPAAQLNVNLEVYHMAETASQSSGLAQRSHSLGATLLGSSQTARTGAMLAARQAGYLQLKSSAQLYIPPVSSPPTANPPHKTYVNCEPKRAYANAHTYHINSVSVNSDGESFISADDLRINLWHLNVSNQTFNIVDIKPDNMEDLTEVITAAEFHPTDGSTFAYSNSRGSIKLVDMRQSALCHGRSVKAYEEEEQPGDKSFFSEIIASISDIKFTRNGNYIVARDYLSLKIWDMKMERRPVKTIPIHEHLKPKLHDLYENDCIFDKFECVTSPDGKFFATGSYHNYLHVFDRSGNQDVIEATNSAVSLSKKSSQVKRLVTDPGQLDYSKKITSLSWHPEQNVIAVCGLNNLYLFTK
ncbi:hypothetical protein BASA81_006110 [Batrachochytrium salamandrivorans]|nr:hypothetical protein BASA81_006110 [Batrachochytrium salamandrivorans]